jgi:ATP-dependent Clp protease ATP-binding subunit ClpC
MEEGRLTDSFGRNVDFRNTILIMTTNAGAEAIKNESAFGFQAGGSEDASYDAMKTRVVERIEKQFRPEFLNRLDDVIVFRHLSEENLKLVIEYELAKVRERLEDRGYALEMTDAAKQYIIKRGCKDLDYGARPLRRELEQRVEDVLAEELLKGTFQGKNKIIVDGIKDDNDKVVRLDFRGEFVGEEAEEPEVAAAGSDSEG